MHCPICHGAGIVRRQPTPPRSDPFRHQQYDERVCPGCFGGDLDAHFAQVDADRDAEKRRAAKPTTTEEE